MHTNSLVPVVLLEVKIPALKVLRDLGRQGIRIIGIVEAAEGNWEASSRYCETRVFSGLSAGGEALLDYLKELSEELGNRPVLIPMNDDLVLFMASYEDRLSKWFRFLISDPVVMRKLISKDGVKEMADKAGIPQPMSASPANCDQAGEIARSIRYPALIKPTFSRAWFEPPLKSVVNEGKVVTVSCADELMEKYQLIARYNPDLVIQEEIPGDDPNLVYYVGFFDEHSEPLASFVGVKERVIPVHYGSASYVVSKHIPEVVEQSIKFMQAVGYRGHVGIEYKYDNRDGKYKLIEVNARYGLWDGMATLCGINFADLNYRYLLGQTPAYDNNYTEGVKWISFQRDFPAFVHYHKEGSLGLAQWLKSICSGRRDYAVFAWDDLKPFILSSGVLAVVYTKAVMKRLRRKPGCKAQAAGI